MSKFALENDTLVPQLFSNLKTKEMFNKFRVSFYLRKDLKKDGGEVPILVRIYLRSERVNVCSTKIYIDPTLWDNESCSLKGRSATAMRVNGELQRIEQDLMMIYRRYEFRDDLSLENIKNDYLGKSATETTQSFVKFYEEYTKKAESEVGISRSKESLQKYSVTGKHFKNFLKKDHRRNDIPMKELDVDIIDGFFNYLVRNGIQSHNTAMKTLQNIHTVVLYAIHKGLIAKDPFVDFHFHFKQKDRGFLDDAEINAIMSYHFSTERLELVRDIFIFSCFTGLAYIDVCQLKTEHIVTLDNVHWIMKPRQKTAVPSRIPLLEVPKQILVKYVGRGKDGHLLPVISNQKVNAYLKEIATLCGIKKNLTFHLARHTFATLTLSKGVPIETVSKMLGHTNIKTTQIYARVTNKKIESDMAALAGKLLGFSLEGESNTPTAKHSGSTVEELPPVDETKPSKKRGRPKKADAGGKTHDVTSNAKPAVKRGRHKRTEAATTSKVEVEKPKKATRVKRDK